MRLDDRDICEVLRAMGGKLNYVGLEKAPAKSTACDGLRNRDNKFFEDVYFRLVLYTNIKVFCRTAEPLGSPLKKY